MPSLLFACIHNACRSQIAEAIGKRLAPPSWTIASAGTSPSEQVDPKAVDILRRNGLSMNSLKPKGFTALPAVEWDCAVCIGCGDMKPHVSAKRYVRWDIPDPEDGPMALYEALFAELSGRIRALIQEVQSPPHGEQS